MSGTQYAIKEVLHLYLMPLLAKGISLGERLEKKEGGEGVYSLYLSVAEKHEEINTVLSCCSRVISEARRRDLRGAYRSRMCPGTEGGTLLRDMVCVCGGGQISHVCVKRFKDELNSDIKVRF